ncbi:PDDEXK-like family protein [Bacillus tuaregi]|uniref:PDDEXK-like family protein n=1 Tax=Bacillus tuaregi TaxID=1816695 RepID=UPI001F2A166C|nr:PD-(D/E)XK nuclease family protein [Bacillus tuaregi]
MLEEDRKAIEDFLMDVDILDHLESKISNFNIFETLGIVNTEIRHSNVIAWLLTPDETHGLDDIFIKKFLQEVFYNHRNSIQNSNIDLFKISLMDYRRFIVRREWRNIDLLIFSDEYKIVIIIENKIWSKESNKQLNKYNNTIQEEFLGYNKFFLFLTPIGDRPSDEENWFSINYHYIIEALEKSKALKKDNISIQAWTFMEHYLEILRRYIVGDKELEKICREIYYKHQKALDLIFEYKPDIYSEIAETITDKLINLPNIILDVSGKTYIRFTTSKLDSIITAKGSGWTNTKRILLFEVQNRTEKVVLKLIIGPGKPSTRDRLFDISTQHKDKFIGRSIKLRTQYTQIFSKELISKSFFEQNDVSSIKEKLIFELKQFLNKNLIELEEIILNNFPLNDD